MNDNKTLLRKWAKERRAQLKNDEADKQIAHHFLQSELFARDTFFVYLSMGTEVDTSRILHALNEHKKQICVPYLTGKEMISARMIGDSERGAFGILQPKRAIAQECEVALVPLLCADRQGNRVGYGGGYYDRYFQLHEKVLRVGLCYEGQLIERVEFEEFDRPLDYLITERGIITCNRREIAEKGV